MYPDPGWQAQQRFDQSRRFQRMNDDMDAQRRRRARGGSGSGLGGLLKLALLVGVVVLLVQNPELRDEAWTFVTNLWADVQNS